MVPQDTQIFRFLWLMIFLGGIGRLISMVSVGPPLRPFIGYTVLEIVDTPLFVYWQHRLVQNKKG